MVKSRRYEGFINSLHAVRLSLGRSDGDALLRSVVQEVVATLEALEEGGVTPRCNDFKKG